MTAELKISPELIELGKALVAQLEDNGPGRDDMLSKWMAHDIAAKILAAGTDPTNAQAQSDCAEAILRLWEHRAVYPHPKRPTDQYEDILLTLERLAPDRKATFYAPPELKSPGPETTWLNAAVTFDRAARILITYVLQQAALRTEGGFDWGELSYSALREEPTDLRALRAILTGPAGKVSKPGEPERERLLELVANLKEFREAARLVEAELQAEINSLEESRVDGGSDI
jgi:hypothetical protein